MKNRLRQLSLLAVFSLAVAGNGQGAQAHRPNMPAPTRAEIAQHAFDAWLPAFRRRAMHDGIRPETLSVALDGIHLNSEILQEDRHQPEFTKTFEEYEQSRVTPSFIAAGRREMRDQAKTLHDYVAAQGVQPEVVVALEGFESNFGRVQGKFYVPEALATLAAAGRKGKHGDRRQMFEGWLLDTLHLIQNGTIDARDARGSWAACQGMFQFSSGDIRAHAVDVDGHGIDIWKDKKDAFASAAKKLADDGWRAGESWGARVALPPNFNLDRAGFGKHKPIGEWRRLGVMLADGSSLPGDDNESVEIIAPGSDRKGYRGGPVFMARHNFDVLMKWNSSSYFVASVGEAADAIAAAGPSPSSSQP